MELKTQSKPTTVFVLLMISWVNAFVLLWHRQSLLSEAPLKASFCNISSYFNCDAVALSSYSAFLGIPTAAWGMAFYGVLLLLTYFAFQKPKEFLPIVSLASLIALVPTGYQAFNSFYVIKALCLMCLFSYLLNILVAAFSFQLLSKNHLNFSSVFAQIKSFSGGLWGGILGIVLVSFFMPTLVVGIIGSQPIDASLAKAAMDSYHMSSVKNFNTDRSPSMGASAENAKVTIVEFSDFQCPHCARSAMLMPSLIKPYEDRVRFVSKSFPLDPSCNSKIQGAGHNLACLAAKAGRCVFENTGSPAFFSYKKEVFENQEKLNAELIKNIAIKYGEFDTASLDGCLNDQKTHDAVVADVHEGDAAGVQGTPAIYINGKSFAAGPQPTLLKQLLEDLLK